MTAATRINLQSIDDGLAWFGRLLQGQQAAIARQTHKRFEEARQSARQSELDAEEHQATMKVIEARQAALQRQDLADRRAGQEALRAWREAPHDRRDR